MQLLSDNSYSKILEEVKKLCNLQIENAKLQLTEKLTLLLAKIMLVAIVLVMSVVAMIFTTIAFAQWIKAFIDPALSYCIIALFYLLIALIVYAFRRQWIIDPIARFISRVILNPPSQPGQASPLSTHHSNSNPKV